MIFNGFLLIFNGFWLPSKLLSQAAEPGCCRLQAAGCRLLLQAAEQAAAGCCCCSCSDSGDHTIRGEEGCRET